MAFPRHAKLVLAIGIALNLCLLAYFKYAHFAFHVLGQSFSVSTPPWITDIVLPLGISFYTFETMSYLIDVYRGDVVPQKNFLKFTMYKTMFPQLIAGPIVRYRDIAAEIDRRPVRNEEIWVGIKLFITGLAQKVLIANTVAIAVDRVFALDPSTIPLPQAWVAITCYAIQILYDFSGYSNMAIGIGPMIGFTFPPNFEKPYTSRSITEFWRRWHISLSSWFRDYLYVPLGGNRISAWRTYLNLSIVFLLCGLWHGAAWTFIIWGAWHGLLLILKRAGGNKILQRLPAPRAQAYTLIAIMLGWVFFRVPSAGYAFQYLRALFVPSPDASSLVNPWQLNFDLSTLCALAIGLFLAVTRLNMTDVVGHKRSLPPFALNLCELALAVAGLILCVTSLAAGTYNPFIYFQF